MKQLTERQVTLVLRALGFYRKHIIDIGLPELENVKKRIDLIYLQLTKGQEMYK